MLLKSHYRTITSFSLAYCYLALIFLNPAFSANAIAGENNATQHISIHKAWIREAPPNSKILAAYLEIQNNSTEDVTLMAAESKDFERIEFHLSEMSNGVARMQAQKHILIPANSSFTFSPGAYHLMLFNPASAMREGKHAAIKFIFADGETLTVDIPVKRSDSTDAHQHHEHHH